MKMAHLFVIGEAIWLQTETILRLRVAHQNEVITILNGTSPTAEKVAHFPVYDADAVGIYVTNPPKGTKGAFEVVAYPDSTLLFKFRDGAFESQRLGN